MRYSNSWLFEQVQSNVRTKYVFFWGHQPSKDGSVSASCFSQWWVAPFEVNGVTYPTAEHWMMAGKAKLFRDEDLLEKIIAAPTPAEAKKLGRQVRDFEPAPWERAKMDIVVKGNYHKFSAHAALRHFLIQTGDRILVEASPADPIWGIGLAADDPRAAHPHTWRGENLLGYALMEVRDLLRGREDVN